MENWGWLITLVVLLVLIGIILSIYHKVKRTARQVARGVFGKDSLREGFAEQAQLLASTPKSVSAMTKIYLPQIVEDFPEFDWPQFRLQSENALKGALLAVSGQNPALLGNASAELQNQVRLAIEDDRHRGVRSRYEDIKIHRTEITRYHKLAGACMVTLQSAVGHMYWEEKDGAVTEGSKELPVQTRYEMDLVYIQDETQFVSQGVTGAGLTCPNCGAPISQLGHKQCSYCGMAVAELNLRVWSLSEYWEVQSQ